MPAEHPAVLKLPAVSGSSGRLVISPAPRETATPSAPGLVFADASLAYPEAMRQFVAASPDAQGHATERVQSAAAAERLQRKAQRQAWLREADALRLARHQLRAQRKVEDQAWQALRKKLRRASAKRKRLLRLPRRAQQRQRASEDEQWRAQRGELRAKLSPCAWVSSWIAILVITDNCTRQCLGLPLFVSGPKVTAELIVAALQALLPPELQFLISDRGTHFVAKAFQALQPNPEFMHVLIARHRPQSNGIAERFVRTLKEWLAMQSWQTASELETLLAQFRPEYNDRPHRGLAIPGLSPNEFANRCWLQ